MIACTVLLSCGCLLESFLSLLQLKNNYFKYLNLVLILHLKLDLQWHLTVITTGIKIK